MRNRVTKKVVRVNRAKEAAVEVLSQVALRKRIAVMLVLQKNADLVRMTARRKRPAEVILQEIQAAIAKVETSLTNAKAAVSIATNRAVGATNALVETVIQETAVVEATTANPVSPTVERKQIAHAETANRMIEVAKEATTANQEPLAAARNAHAGITIPATEVAEAMTANPDFRIAESNQNVHAEAANQVKEVAKELSTANQEHSIAMAKK